MPEKSNASNRELEYKGIAAVKTYERDHGRIAADAPIGSGYDLSSTGHGRKRCIEVKSTKYDKLPERHLEPNQFRELLRNPNYYFYAVLDVDSGNPRIEEFTQKEFIACYVRTDVKYIFNLRDHMRR